MCKYPLYNNGISLKYLIQERKKHMKPLKMAVIGLGSRGSSITKHILLNMSDVEVVALCDEYDDRNQKMAGIIEDKTGKRPYTSVS